MSDVPTTLVSRFPHQVVRVKVPNPQPGKSILRWQFCTEFYDIGFGLDFEPATPEGQEPELKTLLAVNRIMADEAVSIGNHIEVGLHLLQLAVQCCVAMCAAVSTWLRVHMFTDPVLRCATLQPAA